VIKPGTNYTVSYGSVGGQTIISWYSWGNCWVLYIPCTPQEIQTTPGGAQLTKLYTQAELEALQAAGWKFEAIK
jgi:hypothetical protein